MRYTVHVKLHKNFIKVAGDIITVGVKAPPERGRANEEVIRRIAEHFGVSCASVRMVAGRTARRKVIEL